MAKLPKGTYSQTVFNPGIDKTMPFGFVDVVYSRRTGEGLGFIKNGNFYKFGEKADDATPKKQKADTKDVPSIQEQRAAQSERDSLSNKLKELEKNGDTTSQEYQNTYNEYTAAQKRLDDVNAKIDAYVKKNKQYEDEWKAARAKQEENAYQEVNKIVTAQEEAVSAKEAAANEKKRKNLEAEKADAERRGDSAAAARAQRDINNIPKATAPQPTATPTEAPKTSGRAQEAGVNKVTPTTAQPPATATGTTATTASTAGAVGQTEGTLPKTPKAKKVSKSDRQLSAEQILQEYQFVDDIINQDPKIKQAYIDFVNGKIEKERFKNIVLTSDYVRKNSEKIRQRIYNKSVYNDLGPEDKAAGTSQYARDISKVFNALRAQAIEDGASPSDEELKLIADRLYMLGQEDDTNAISAAIRPYVKAGLNAQGFTTAGGAAGSNYTALVKTAYENGIEASRIPSLLGYDSPDAVLQALQSGEAINTLQNKIRSYASTGQSDFVKNQMSQGVNLRAIAQPYIDELAAGLELQPDSIKLSDPMIQTALQNQGMTLFDFKKLIRKDNRWQYTKAAEQDVANKTMRILQDFGFEA